MRTKFILLFALVFGCELLARADSLTLSTLAGNPGQGSKDGIGTTARFANPWGVAIDGAGNLYVADTENNTIRKITPAGLVTTIAGAAGVRGSADGLGTNALFYLPQGIALDTATNLYVTDTGNHTVRKITPAGAVTTLAGLAGVSGTNNAIGSNARFYEPQGIAVNSAGSLIYVADSWNHTIRQVTAAGSVSTLAGVATVAGTNNGTGTAASFNVPQGIAVDGDGNVYVGDTGNQMIRKISAGGIVTTLAGSAGNYGTNNGSVGAARFWDPQGVALDGATNVYVADSMNDTIRKITPAGTVTTLAGAAGTIGSADGTGSTARFWQPQGVIVDAAGNIYVTDSANGTIRRIAAGAIVSTLAGAASIGSADGSGASARFNGPSGVAIDNGGTSYVADTINGTIRQVNSGGAVTTLAGSAGAYGTNDGSGASARFYGPQGITVNGGGNLIYVADTANHTIRKVTAGGAVSTLAGNGGTNGVSDGTGRGAAFNYPQGVAQDVSGNVYVADTWNHAIRKVTAAGAVTTLAGVAGLPGDIDSNMDGNGTNAARFNCPSSVAVDATGNIYVADTRNHTIRKVTPSGEVSTIAGVAGVWGSVDGANNLARFYLPDGIAVDGTGNVYVNDSGNHITRMLALSGTNWIVSTVAGSPGVAGSANGAGTNATMFYPAGIALNNVAAFSIADFGNNAIRSGVSSANSSPSIITQPQDQVVNQGADATFAVNATGSAPLLYQWFFNSALLAGATNSEFTVNAQPGSAGSYSVVVSNLLGSIGSSNALLTVIVPPHITNGPQNIVVDQGLNATFTVQVSGTTPFSYQWFFGIAPIPGATSASLELMEVQPSDAGNYSVIVSNAAGSSTGSATLSVNLVPTPPGIRAGGQPQNLTVVQGSNATFSVVATGSTPFSYQWCLNGGAIAGATESGYTKIAAQGADAGSYSVIITNIYGTITSAPASLTVILPPIINIQPANQLSSVSNSATFFVGLSQGTSPTYQWQQNGAAIAGATESSLQLSSLKWSDAGTYSVVVSNLAGTQTSTGATLVVQQAVFTFFDGFESYSTGSLDNNTVGGPNTASSNPWWGVNTSAQGWITNAASGITPHGGLQMDGAAGSIRQEYINLPYRMNAGQLYYGNFMCDWWFYDPYGTTPSGATNFQEYLALAAYAPVSTTSDSSTFTAFNQRMSLGAYNGNVGYNYSNYQARIIGGSGTFGSQNSWYNTATIRSVGWHHARIVVGVPNPSTLLAPVSMYIDNMTNATVSSPTTGTTFGFNLVELNHQFKAGYAGYYDDFTFRAANDPWIVEQPADLTLAPGASGSFTTVAVGTGYQWQFNGTDIPGATGSSYTVISAAATNVGQYRCLVAGTNGVLAGDPGTLTVTAPPAIVVSPASLSVTQGQNASFVVNAMGAGPLHYQWRFNTNDVSVGTEATLTLAAVNVAQAGSYSVIVSNDYGSATSATALLTVVIPPLPGSFGFPLVLANGSLQLVMSGSPNSNYVLEYTTDWMNWTVLTNFASASGLFEFDDTSVATNRYRFYRIRLVP